MMGQTIIFSHKDPKEGGFSHEEGRVPNIANTFSKAKTYDSEFIAVKKRKSLHLKRFSRTSS